MVLSIDNDACGAAGALRHQELGEDRREDEDQELTAGQGKVLQHHRPQPRQEHLDSRNGGETDGCGQGLRLLLEGNGQAQLL